MDKAFLSTLTAAGIAVTGFTGNALAVENVQGIHNAPTITRAIEARAPATIERVRPFANMELAITDGIETFDRTVEGLFEAGDRAGEAFDKAIMPKTGPLRGVDKAPLDRAFEKHLRDVDREFEAHLRESDVPAVKPPVIE